MKTREQKLESMLLKTTIELDRLHYLLAPRYEGKVGEPDLKIIRKAMKLLGRIL